jgi:hypothetical protein
MNSYFIKIEFCRKIFFSYLSWKSVFQMVLVLKMLHLRDGAHGIVFQDLRTDAILVDVAVVRRRALAAAESSENDKNR